MPLTPKAPLPKICSDVQMTAGLDKKCDSFSCPGSKWDIYLNSEQLELDALELLKHSKDANLEGMDMKRSN
jgi:hypothetical protein